MSKDENQIQNEVWVCIVKNAPLIEEVYNIHYDTGGNLRWTGTKSGEHIVYANTQIMQSIATREKYDLAKREYTIEDFEEERREKKMKEFNYLKEKARMLTAIGCREDNVCFNCSKCPFDCINNGYRIACMDFEMSHPDEVTGIVRKWAEARPVKTRKDVLLEKFPNAEVDKDGTPRGCARSLGFIEGKKCVGSCMECWNTEVEE